MSVKRVFTVDGKPFFPLGGQAHNNSGYTPEEMATAWKALAEISANTAEVPIPWELVEPREGEFDFTAVDNLVQGARAHGFKLIILWFASWKNGMMNYTPEWVKCNPERFKRVITHDNIPIAVLSTHCAANWQADQKAFSRLMAYIRKIDEAEKTVIGIQIENEPGCLGSERDFGLEAEREYQSAVPQELAAKVKEAKKTSIYAAWKEAGAHDTSTWEVMFGYNAADYFSAWSLSKYVDRIAEAGKKAYAIPMFVNVWIKETFGMLGFQIAGLDYPSGGPVSSNLDLWKWNTPHIDILAPDNYIRETPLYSEVCRIYSREDNPLFIPESEATENNALTVFHGIADYNLIGCHIFGVETIMGQDGTLMPWAVPIAESFKSIRAALPLILKYQGSGKIHAVVQQEYTYRLLINLDDYIGQVLFFRESIHDTELDPGIPKFDYHHEIAYHRKQFLSMRGKGLIFQAGKNEFYLVGGGYRLLLQKKNIPLKQMSIAKTSSQLFVRLQNYICVDEGHFDQEGNWSIDRRRNGDETDHGVWMMHDVGVVHVKMTD
jgi:hypothetical protein